MPCALRPALPRTVEMPLAEVPLLLGCAPTDVLLRRATCGLRAYFGHANACCAAKRRVWNVEVFDFFGP